LGSRKRQIGLTVEKGYQISGVITLSVDLFSAKKNHLLYQAYVANSVSVTHWSILLFYYLPILYADYLLYLIRMGKG
jgi:predicted Zn-dependent protease